MRIWGSRWIERWLPTSVSLPTLTFEPPTPNRTIFPRLNRLERVPVRSNSEQGALAARDTLAFGWGFDAGFTRCSAPVATASAVPSAKRRLSAAPGKTSAARFTSIPWASLTSAKPRSRIAWWESVESRRSACVTWLRRRSEFERDRLVVPAGKRGQRVPPQFLTPRDRLRSEARAGA